MTQLSEKQLYKVRNATRLRALAERKLAAKRLVMKRHGVRTSWYTRARTEAEAIEKRIARLTARIEEPRRAGKGL